MASSGSERSARRPRIGLTTYRESGRWGIWECEAVLLPSNYVDMVWRAGGVPVLLPPVPDGAEEATEGVDAVLVAGGGDIEPERYGAQRHEQCGGISPLRDSWEVAVVRAALALRKPLLGVCRGLQVLNVAAGGTLHQHVPDVVGHDGHRPAPAVFGTTPVRIDPESLLHRLLGDD
ncbi:MAG: gamma-glutamyl-gamma-aminobutyrate hydrolase family protein, partial [Actinomycetota bacterium]|nr:gamma-glutamyl-gamma-aminobutyrate hydrolase family protein [Actinomycetota bacterium]